MPAPWEKYQTQQKSGPWMKYQGQASESQEKIPDVSFQGLSMGGTDQSADEAPGSEENGFLAQAKNFMTHPIGVYVPIAGPVANYFTTDAVKAQNAADTAQFEKKNPGAANLQQAIGSAGALTFPVPGMGMTGPSGIATRIAGGAGLAAADAATQGQDMGDAASTAAKIQGAMEAVPVLGHLAAPIVKPVMTGAERLGQYLKDTAAMRATKAALGNVEKSWKQVGDRAIPVGTEGIESGAVRFGDNANNIEQRAGNMAKSKWKNDIQGAFDAADEAGISIEGKNIAENILQRAADMKPIPKNLPRIEELQKEALHFEKKGQMSVNEAQEYKNEYDWKQTDNKLHDILGKNGNNLMDKAIGDEIKKTVEASGVPNAENFRGDYKSYGNLKTLEAGAEKNARKQAKNRTISLTDYLAGGAGALAGATLGDWKDSTLAAGILSAANHAMRTRGNSALGVTLYKMGKTLQASPELASKYYNVIASAAQRGAASLAVTHQLLSAQDSDYRAATEGDQ